MIEHLQNSPVVWTILTICSLLTIPSLFFAIYTWIKGKQKKEFTMSKDGYCIVREGKKNIKKVSLLFDGKEIEDLSVTKFVIWNSGNVDIRREDIASERPLMIHNIGSASILDANIIVETDSTNHFSVDIIDSDKIIIDFEYANKKDGIVVQVIHTGDWEDLAVDYKIKGGEPIRNFVSDSLAKKILFYDIILNRLIKEDIRKKAASISMFITFLINFIFSINILLIELHVTNSFLFAEIKGLSNAESTNTGFIIVVVCFILLSLSFMDLGVGLIKDAFKIGIPSKLKNYTKYKDESNNV